MRKNCARGRSAVLNMLAPKRFATAIALAAAFLHVPSWAKEPVNICFVDDRSGSAADTGIQSYHGFLLAVAEANAAGGIDGREIKVVEYDGKTDPQLTATFASRCAEDDGTLAIIGGNPGAPAASMIPIATEYEIPYLMLSAGQDSLTDAPAPFHFRVGPSNYQDAHAIAELVQTQGFERVGIINNSVPFGTDAAHAVREELTRRGVEIVVQQTYDINATDLSPQVSSVRRANPDVVLVFPYPADGARVLRTMQQLGMKTPRIVARSALLQTLRQLAGEASNGVLIPNTVDIQRPDVQQFLNSYEERFGNAQPTMYPVLGYDAANIVFKAMMEPHVSAALDDGDLAAARIGVRDAIVTDGRYAGLQGKAGATYQFGPDRRHGPPDSEWFVFVEVAENGTKLIEADIDSFKPQL